MSSPISTDPARVGHGSTPFWTVVRNSLRGEQRDYTCEPLNRAVLLLAVPMVLEMVMESLFAVVGVFWVSRLGKEAIAVVGITEAIMSLIYAVAIGISIAATAIVARRIGEQDPERAARAAGQIIALGVMVSVILGIALAAFASPILRLMGADDTVVEIGKNFSRIMLGFNGTVFLIFLINAIFRGAGDAVIAMRTLWLANALNIVLCPCFIFGLGPFPEMGVTGVAVATNIGRGIGVLYQLLHLVGDSTRLRLHVRYLRPARDMLRSIIAIAGNGILQLLISTTSWVGLFKILALFGNAPLAGYTISVRLVMFVLLPAWGLANAAATLVGQNLGANRPDRAEAAVSVAMRYNMLLLSIIGAMFLVFARPLIGLFTSDQEVLIHGARALGIVSLAFPFYAAGMCLGSAFNGAGDTWTPTRLNFFCFWAGQVPISWVLAESLRLGPTGVFIAAPVACSVLAVWSALLFRRGKWKEQKV